MRDLVCASGLDLVIEYLEGVLPDDVRAAVDAHVAGCPKCVAFLASYRETPRIVRDVTGAALPADVRASLHAVLRAARNR